MFSIIMTVMVVCVIALLGMTILEEMDRKQPCPICGHTNVPEIDDNYVCENCNKNYKKGEA